MSKIDRLESMTARQISKYYNDALTAAVRKSKDFLRRAKDVTSGKTKPPSGLRTEKQIEAWKRGYMRRALKQTNTIETIANEMREAGVKTRKRTQSMMSTVYSMSSNNTAKLLDKTLPAGLPEVTRRQAQILLYGDGHAGAFSKIAFKAMGEDARVTKRLRNEFAAGIMKGESDEKLIKRIRTVTGMELNDAKRVLRTERTHIESLAEQDAALEHYRQTGIRHKKMWICSFHNSRESHIQMHGQTVFIDQDFILPSGQPISYPGDSRAGAAEVCNCQCRIEIIAGDK